MKQKRMQKNSKGITLIALVITIIILIILSGISIVSFWAKNGILTKASDTSEESKREQIKERISLVVGVAEISGNGKIESKILDNELEKEFGKDNYKLAIVGKGYLIFVDNVCYKLDGDTKETFDYDKNTTIEYAGDLSKNGKYDGKTEETAYRINCIEDLLEWDNNYSKYIRSFINLERTLDFEDIYSYNDFSAITNDINNNNKNEYLITELTTGTGFKPIKSFDGTFDGKNHEIKNMYQNINSYAGLYINLNANIKNLVIKVNITSKSYAGAISAKANNSTIENCSIEGKLTCDGIVGGVVGIGFANANLNINKCCNKSIINSTQSAGGIIGMAYPAYITNCYNLGNINSEKIAGGIIGDQNYYLTIYNSYNRGLIKSNMIAGGIIGRIYSTAIIKNTYNTGIIEGNKKQTGGIAGTALWNNPSISIENSFYLKGTAKVGTNNCKDTTSIGEDEKMKSEEFINKLNNYIDNNQDIAGNWVYWKKEESSYPILNLN